MENISKNLDENIKHMKDVFKNDNTFISRPLETGGGLRCCAFFCDGMVSTPVVNEAVIKPLVLWDDKIPEGQEISFLKTRILQANDIKIAKTFEDIYLGILYGDTAVLCEEADMALVINTKGFALRSISEPGSEKIVTGPKEGFTEGIMQNISLVRRKLKTPKLKFSFSNLGDVSNTICCVCYIDGIADENVLQKVKHRLSQVKIDGIMSSSYIEEMIADKRLPLFDLMGKTERPDVLAAKLLEGRVAVMVDGTPVALTAPCIIAEQFQSPEDYYVNPFYASFSRIVRMISLFISLSALPVYVALITYHMEMLPSALLFSIAEARDNVPFPTFLEALFLLFAFDVLREAAKRTPDVIGQTMGIVGALILGQAAVEARFVSAPMVIVVALSGITGLMVSNFRSLVTVMRIILICLASVMGLYGYIIGMLWLLAWMASTYSFGVSILSNITSYRSAGKEDTFVRTAWSRMKPSGRFLGRKK